jgi:hypothetical protein
MTNECDGTCGGERCLDCGEHFHRWDGYHECHEAARRAMAASLARFLDALKDATAVRSGSGMAHAVNCPQVRAHITFAENLIARDDTAYWTWSPWMVTYADRADGHTGLCCSPPITVQPPQPRPAIFRARLTGLGWPEGDRCARGHLPEHIRVLMPKRRKTWREKLAELGGTP